MPSKAFDFATTLDAALLAMLQKEKITNHVYWTFNLAIVRHFNNSKSDKLIRFNY